MKISDLMQKDTPNNPETNARNEAAGSAPVPQQGAPAQEQGQPMPEEGMPPEEAGAQPGAESDEPTPEEQAQYEKVVMAGIKVLTEATDQVMQMLQAGADNPPQALADATWTIMTALDEKAGGNIDEGILIAAGGEVMQNVGEFANEGQVFAVDEKVLNQGWQIIMQRLSDEYGIDWGAEMGPMIQSMDQAQLEQIVAQQQQYAGG